MKRILLLLVVVLLFLAGCGTKEDEKVQTSGDMDRYEGINTSIEAKEGDFIYRLATEEGIYHQGDELRIFAELEYVGDDDNVTIYHAASPFFFPMTEKTRGYTIDYPMNQPLVSTTLQKGKPIREVYKSSGAYSDQDTKEFIQFMKSFLTNDIPSGHYVVHGFTNFYIEQEGSSPEVYTIEGQIEFKVKEK